MIRNAANADIIILTLGLIEAWYHILSGLYANSINPILLARYRDQFQLHLLDVKETLECLKDILKLLKKVHKNGNFHLIITVSSVPLSATFTKSDIIIANQASKSILRAAANEFINNHENVDYFTCFEIVNNSSKEMAWRPDKIHINPSMVAHIVKTFYEMYHQQCEAG